MGHNPIPPARPPTDEELMAANLAYLREKYAIDFITLDELEEGLDSVLRGGPVNVPKTTRYPDVIRLGKTVSEKNGIVATDLCDCVIRPGADYPACPHDLRGAKGAVGATGSSA